MDKNFYWINSKEIPYRGFHFTDVVYEVLLTSAHPQDLLSFFKEIERLIQKGYYALGFITYEAGYLFEKKLVPLFKEPKTPIAHFIFFKNRNKIELFPLTKEPNYKISALKFNISKEEYKSAVHRIKEYIVKGDTYQINYTGKFHFIFEGDPWEFFVWLLFAQRCEYACYFSVPSYTILSLSPELFIKKSKDFIMSSPMKGTLKRGAFLAEDVEQKRALKKDLKTQAENVMILDLIRNDLGRICEKGTVWCKELFKITTYPTLHQMISTISGNLKTQSLFEIFKALFPCGSVTGAPKIRSMEIIGELEKEPRNVYTGAMGFITPKGDFLFNVAIRSALLFPEKENKYKGELGVGAGIVWDSSFYKEYLETKLKAQFFLKPQPYFSLIETFKWDFSNDYDQLFLHYNRLLSSAKYFNFKIPSELKSFPNFLSFIESSLSKSSTGKYKVRLLLSPEGKIDLEISPLKQSGWEEPIKVLIIKRKTKVNLFHYHKTTLRKEYDEMRALALERGFTEVLFYNEKKELLEGAISNLFLERDGLLYTPPVNLGILPGVLRESLIRAKKAVERVITIKDLENEQVLYIGNSVRGLGKVDSYIIM
ncbi:MAG: aminodeoxychorismate synthase component I [Caldimicrobium sp.]